MGCASCKTCWKETGAFVVDRPFDLVITSASAVLTHETRDVGKMDPYLVIRLN